MTSTRPTLAPLPIVTCLCWQPAVAKSKIRVGHCSVSPTETNRARQRGHARVPRHPTTPPPIGALRQRPLAPAMTWLLISICERSILALPRRSPGGVFID